jgi:putative ABC transport system permease protein
MRAHKILEMAVSNLKQRKLRTALTTLGVIIGITTIIGLASLGEGLRTEIKTRMQAGFELNNLIVFPGSLTAGFGEPFGQTDLNNIRNVPNVKLATGIRTLAEVKVYNSSGARLHAVTVAGINFTEMQQMLPERFILAAGTFPSDNDISSIVLGYTAATNNGTRAVNVGDNVTVVVTLHLNATFSFDINETLTVSGILEKGGTSGITNFDYWAFVTMRKATAIEFGREAYQIILVKVIDAEHASETAKDIENTFENPYRVSVFVPSSFIQQVDNILNIIQIFLLAVASISLLVAGIGIMNIMTVSVMERTREIGILKAIGAKSRTILTMFLTEAAVIGVVGGLIGIFMGYGISYGLASLLSSFIRPQQQDTLFATPGRQELSISPIFTPEWTIAAFIFAVTICIIFGLYPARKASKLNPVEALHYE